MFSTGETTVYLFTDAQPVQFLHSTIPSVTCLRLSDASVLTAWVGCTNVTDRQTDRQTTDRQTDRQQTDRRDGRLIAYSKRNVIRWRLLKSRHFQTQNRKIFSGGAMPLPRPLPYRGGDTLSPNPIPLGAFAALSHWAPSAPRCSRLRRSTLPPFCKSWIRHWVTK